MKKIKTTGIYKITNLTNNKVYIGKSKNIERRWDEHKSRNALKLNKNSLLYRDFIKYGLNEFKFDIIKICKEEELDKNEKRFIKGYRSNELNYGYNKTLGGNGVLTIEYSPRKKAYVKGDISESIYKGRKVICLNDDRIFYTIKSASKFYNVDRSGISKVLNGKRNTIGGLIFREYT